LIAQPHDVPPGDAPRPERNLRAIRAALIVPQDRDAFDSGLKAVLDEVRVTLDLRALNDFIHRWWISACDSVKDPDGRRRMHARAAEIESGAPIPSSGSWRDLLASRGVDL
jgi:hypothetical protein